MGRELIKFSVFLRKFIIDMKVKFEVWSLGGQEGNDFV